MRAARQARFARQSPLPLYLPEPDRLAKPELREVSKSRNWRQSPPRSGWRFCANSCENILTPQRLKFRRAKSEDCCQDLVRMLAEQGRRCHGCCWSVVNPEGRRVVDALTHFGMHQLHPMAAMAKLRIVVDDIRRRPDNACRYARELQRRHQVLRVPVAGDGGYALVDRVTILPTTMGRGQLRRPRKGRITKDLAQSRPRFILPGGNGNPSVLAQAAKDTMRRAWRAFVAGALGDPIVGAAVAHGGAEQRNGWLGLGHVDVLPHSRPPPLTHGGPER